MVKGHLNKRTTVFELVAVVLTVIMKFIFMDWLNIRFLFISFTIISWVSYLIVRFKKDPHSLFNYGFTKDNFISVIKLILPFAISAIVLSTLMGYYKGTLNVTWHILPLLVLYPIWGIIQQFLILGLFTHNLEMM